MARIDMDTLVVQRDGSPYLNDQGLSIRVSVLLVNTIDRIYENETITGEEKYRRSKLASRLYEGGQQEVSAEDIVLMKLLIGRSCGPFIVEQIYDLLEGQTRHIPCGTRADQGLALLRDL